MTQYGSCCSRASRIFARKKKTLVVFFSSSPSSFPSYVLFHLIISFTPGQSLKVGSGQEKRADQTECLFHLGIPPQPFPFLTQWGVLKQLERGRVGRETPIFSATASMGWAPAVGTSIASYLNHSENFHFIQRFLVRS